MRARPALLLAPLALIGACSLVPSLAVAAETKHAPAHKPGPAKPAAPAAPAAGGPKSIGKFDDWQAATVQQAGETACYAFTRVAASSPAVPGRGDVVLTVTQRATGRDAVALTAGFAYQPNAAVTVEVDQTALQFYTAQRSAFARDGHAAVMAFQKGSKALAKSPAPRGSGDITDTFSLRGFTAAYAAIDKACPAK